MTATGWGILAAALPVLTTLVIATLTTAFRSGRQDQSVRDMERRIDGLTGSIDRLTDRLGRHLERDHGERRDPARFQFPTKNV